MCDVVADRFQCGTSWRTLAGDLQPKIKECVIDAIEEDKGRCPNECCRAVLKTWYQKYTSGATSKELMRCLTNVGLANVNLENNERTWTCETGKHSLVREIRSNLQTWLESGGVGLFICKAYYTHFKETA